MPLINLLLFAILCSNHIFRRLKVGQFDFNEKCTKIAEMTEGLSGREIAKLGVAWQVSLPNSDFKGSH